MISIVDININNSYLLKQFLNNTLPNTFRYYTKRTVDVINNHFITILLLYKSIPIGYAHIDYENNKYWFGICILDNYHGKGYGKKIMEYIFNNNKIIIKIIIYYFTN